MKNLSYKPNNNIREDYFQKINRAVRVMTGTTHKERVVIKADKVTLYFQGATECGDEDSCAQEYMWGATMRTKDK
tara:strand:- start:1015 stop:1239 length:225 start_codon:yes stop_codon:yes gene_type:complete